MPEEVPEGGPHLRAPPRLRAAGRAAAVQAGLRRARGGEVGGIGKHPDTGHRTWWAELAAARQEAGQ